MKKAYYLLFVVFFLVFTRVYSQPYGWFSQTSGTVANLNSVYFADVNNGIVVGQSGVVRKTTNSGTNWTAQTSGTPNHLFGVFFINASTGWIVGDVGIILKSTNAGIGWGAQSSTVTFQLTSVSFRDANTGYVVGWYGTFLRTVNGGTTWTKYTTPITTNLNSVSFADANIGFAVGQYGKMVRTSNGGVNWVEVSTGTTVLLEHVIFLNANTGTIIGEGGVIRKTTNAGLNWTNQPSGTGSWLNGMSLQNTTFSTVVGEDGLIRKTSDGGSNWYSQVSNTGNWLRKDHFIDTNTGWAVGDNGTILKTTTGGWLLPGQPTLTGPGNNATCVSLNAVLDWNDVFPPISNYRVHIATDQNFFNMVHNMPGINVSTYTVPNGVLNYNTQYYWRVLPTNQVGEGLTWSSVRNFRTTLQAPTVPNLVSPANNATTNLTPQLRWDSIPAASTYRCRIATDSNMSNIVLDSSNLVNRFMNVPPGRLQPNTRYYWRVNASNSCVTSAYSTRWSFVTSITGITQTGTEIPKVYKLYTNYPNPFNPSTSIKFDVPKGGFVNIEIFNIVGQSVAQLVNMNLNAGSYNVYWDASAYPSGIYFYRMVSSEFNETKKMILVK